MSRIPPPPVDALVYQHPQGKTIYVHPDGTMEVWKPDGTRGTSSATPAKLASGYGGWLLMSGTARKPYVPPTDPTPGSVWLAMTYGSAEVEDLHALAAEPNVVLEQKLDGTRCLAVVSRAPSGEPFIRFLGRNGQPLKHATAAQHFTALSNNLDALVTVRHGVIVLDGEIMQDGTFWVFDLPFATVDYGEISIHPIDTWVDRHCALVDLAESFEGNVRLLPTALDPDTKRALIEQVESTGGEGLMLKHALSPYEPGVRVKHSLKVKYVKTADVLVISRDRGGKKNAVLAVVDTTTGLFTEIGNCSMIGKPDAKPGDVIEVKYLYLGAGGKLYQPRMVRIRDDRTPKSCTTDQFKSYSKLVHA